MLTQDSFLIFKLDIFPENLIFNLKIMDLTAIIFILSQIDQDYLVKITYANDLGAVRV